MKKIFTSVIILSMFVNPLIAEKIDYYKLERLAKTHAQEDSSPKKLAWGLGSFGTSLFLSPLLGGGVMTAIAYSSKGDVSMPAYRYDQVQRQLGEKNYDSLDHYRSIYSLERGKIQKKGNGSAALTGALSCWAFYMVLILNSANSMDTY